MNELKKGKEERTGVTGRDKERRREEGGKKGREGKGKGIRNILKVIESERN